MAPARGPYRPPTPAGLPTGDALRHRRVALGLTQEALAAQTGVPQSRISALEVGRRPRLTDVENAALVAFFRAPREPMAEERPMPTTSKTRPSALDLLAAALQGRARKPGDVALVLEVARLENAHKAMLDALRKAEAWVAQYRALPDHAPAAESMLRVLGDARALAEGR